MRFISGTYLPHVELEHRLAAFHGREAAIIFSSAYATMMGVLPPLITDATIVLSDALNHNCIINAIRLAVPGDKAVYRHLDVDELEQQLQRAAGRFKRAIIVTDGIFSMRGDYAPLNEIAALARRYDDRFPENVLLVVDDSHGIGAFGATGRGTEEHTDAEGVDLLVATLGKAIGVNGGYVVASRTIVDFLRETSPFYVYSNPITPGEAAAARRGARPARQSGRPGTPPAFTGHDRTLSQGVGRSRLRDRSRRPSGRASASREIRPDHRVRIVGHLRNPRHSRHRSRLPSRAQRATRKSAFQVSADHTAADIDHACSTFFRDLAPCRNLSHSGSVVVRVSNLSLAKHTHGNRRSWCKSVQVIADSFLGLWITNLDAIDVEDDVTAEKKLLLTDLGGEKAGTQPKFFAGRLAGHALNQNTGLLWQVENSGQHAAQAKES